jgi:NADH:ubiquinone reductase (H+-translocating)
VSADAQPVRHRVVVIGGGFAGLNAVRGLAGAPVDVQLVDRRNHHLFQPLLYQVATGSLAAGEIATPLRWILRRQRNATVAMAEVEGIDLEGRTVTARGRDGHEHVLPYDTLVVAAGAETAYFGHPQWAADAPGLKSIEDAVELRRRILAAFEAAELEEDPEARRAWLTFVVVGAGPTGVELAGQIGELARDTLRSDFDRIDTATARVLLLDAGDQVLPTLPRRLGLRAQRDLQHLGVSVQLHATVTGVDATGVQLDGDRIAARTVVWAAGVRGSPLASALAAELASGGRVPVEPDLTLRGRPEVLVAGDLALVPGVPGVAPAAMQMGKHAAAVIRARLDGRPPPSRFRYRDRGELATIGRNAAVGKIKGVRVTGRLAWLTWLGVHLAYLVGFHNRVLVLLRWAWSFVTRGRGSRLITEPRPAPPPD